MSFPYRPLSIAYLLWHIVRHRSFLVFLRIFKRNGFLFPEARSATNWKNLEVILWFACLWWSWGRQLCCSDRAFGALGGGVCTRFCWGSLFGFLEWNCSTNHSLPLSSNIYSLAPTTANYSSKCQGLPTLWQIPPILFFTHLS